MGITRRGQSAPSNPQDPHTLIHLIKVTLRYSLVGEWNNDECEESRDSIAGISPIDVRNVSNHQAAANDQCTAGGIIRYRGKDGSEEYRDEEPERDGDRCQAGLSAVRDTSLFSKRRKFGMSIHSMRP